MFEALSNTMHSFFDTERKRLSPEKRLADNILFDYAVGDIDPKLKALAIHRLGEVLKDTVDFKLFTSLSSDKKKLVYTMINEKLQQENLIKVRWLNPEYIVMGGPPEGVCVVVPPCYIISLQFCNKPVDTVNGTLKKAIKDALMGQFARLIIKPDVYSMTNNL